MKKLIILIFMQTLLLISCSLNDDSNVVIIDVALLQGQWFYEGL